MTTKEFKEPACCRQARGGITNASTTKITKWREEEINTLTAKTTKGKINHQGHRGMPKNLPAAGRHEEE
jgi:hypothetical protein